MMPWTRNSTTSQKVFKEQFWVDAMDGSAKMQVMMQNHVVYRRAVIKSQGGWLPDDLVVLFWNCQGSLAKKLSAKNSEVGKLFGDIDIIFIF